MEETNSNTSGKPTARRNTRRRKPKKNQGTKTGRDQNVKDQSTHRVSTNGASSSNISSVESSFNKTNHESTPPSSNNLINSSKKNNKARTKKIQYPDHKPLHECLRRYAQNDKKLIRGKLRVMPGGAMAFVSCDKGSYNRDVVIDGDLQRNRALDGDFVFVEIISTTTADDKNGKENVKDNGDENSTHEDKLEIEQEKDSDTEENVITAQLDEIAIDDDDETHHSLWDPKVHIQKNMNKNASKSNVQQEQYLGEVICIITPKTSNGKLASEINPTNSESKNKNSKPKRSIVGTLTSMPGKNNDRYLFVPNSRSLPRFMTPYNTASKVETLIKEYEQNKEGCDDEQNDKEGNNNNQAMIQAHLCRAEYIYGSWSNNEKWPACVNLQFMGQSCNIEDETMALLIDNGVDHGEFTPEVLKDVERAVASGRTYKNNKQESSGNDLGWEPTEEMRKGRRDYRHERIFTIDPTTAKDLDDALHIKSLPDGRVEIGVHIADVSHFVTPETNVDDEAELRSTTVYLVDRTVPMLPRPLCEIACSLNENVERLAFSVVWRMNKDGTLTKKKSKGAERADDIWYGRTVIKSCSRLDYATAQNIIDRKVACGEKSSDVDEKLWPKSRQPTGDHSIDDVAADVRLMHVVAMARRKLRFQNGALALNGVKLTFQLEEDGQTPALCQPYPIRDSNRLIEEYMLLANFLVAQRLITHAGGLAVLRNHEPPLSDGLQNVIDIAKECGFDIDGKSSKALQESLSHMGRECADPLVMQVITDLLMTPMRPAEYIAAGEYDQNEWHHFALNIPYYTHFTSPIRRYPDIIVHRLLQATLDGKNAVKNFSQHQSEIQSISEHCNDKRMASRKAQDRSDRVFLSLYLKAHPIASTLGVVVSIGEKAFKVHIPKIAVTTMVYLDEHKDAYDVKVQQNNSGQRRMIMIPKKPNTGQRLDINLFTKLSISCMCKEKPPIDVALKVVGPWKKWQQN